MTFDQPDQNHNRGSLVVGSVIGGTYRILDFVGEGGMGYVYKAEHMMMTKVMALKVLRSEQVSQAVWLRFRAEAQAIARLDHENVVRIYDMSQTEDGMPYYTMDLLEGQSLADHIDDNGPLSVALALPIFAQVCSGLAYAHERGIIHRDIKPANIMVTAIGSRHPKVKIVDFGIAKLTALDGTSSQGLTRPGEVVGSPLYMSPEQCGGQALDHRSDMYSVGVTMFQALTGRPPLLGKSAIETAGMHQTTVPPSMVEACGEEFPPVLEQIVARLLAKAPAQRYQSLSEVATLLTKLEQSSDPEQEEQEEQDEQEERREHSSRALFASSHQNTTDIESQLQSKRAILLVAVAVMALGLLATAVFYMAAPKERHNKVDATRKQVAKLREENLASILGDVSAENRAPTEITVSPEARLAAQAWLQKKHGAYATVQTVANKKMNRFDFPKDFSLGDISFSEHREREGRPPQAARGVLLFPYGAKLRMELNQIVFAYPQLLSGFHPDDLENIAADMADGNNRELFNQFHRLTGIHTIDLRGSVFKAADFDSLEKLSNVTKANLSGAKIDSEMLAKTKFLRRLSVLELDSVSNITPILRVLAAKGDMGVLSLNFSKLTDEDLALIGRMKTLWKLSLRGTSIKDNQLAVLADLDLLTDLNLEGCDSLTEKCIVHLAKIKHLKRLKVPENLTTENNYYRVKKVLPRLEKLN